MSHPGESGTGTRAGPDPSVLLRLGQVGGADPADTVAGDDDLAPQLVADVCDAARRFELGGVVCQRGEDRCVDAGGVVDALRFRVGVVVMSDLRRQLQCVTAGDCSVAPADAVPQGHMSGVDRPKVPTPRGASRDIHLKNGAARCIPGAGVVAPGVIPSGEDGRALWVSGRAKPPGHG